MRVFWMLFAVALCLMLTACPKDEEATTEGVDQAGMKRPDAYSEDKPATEGDAAKEGEGATEGDGHDHDGDGKDDHAAGDGHNHDGDGKDDHAGEGEKGGDDKGEGEKGEGEDHDHDGDGKQDH